MSSMDAQNAVSEISMQAVVHRADGTIEDLGTICRWVKRTRWERFLDIFRGSPNVGRISYQGI